MRREGASRRNDSSVAEVPVRIVVPDPVRRAIARTSPTDAGRAFGSGASARIPLPPFPYCPSPSASQIDADGVCPSSYRCTRKRPLAGSSSAAKGR